MSSQFNSNNEERGYENAFGTLHITKGTKRKNTTASASETMLHLEKTTSKSQPFLFKTRDSSRSENSPFDGHPNSLFENEFIEKKSENENYYTKNELDNIDDLVEDGDITFESNNIIVKNDFLSFEEKDGRQYKTNIDTSKDQYLHQPDMLLQGSEQNNFTESQASLCSEPECPDTNLDTMGLKSKEMPNLSDTEIVFDEPDYFDSEEEFSELIENSHDELQMTSFYPSNKESSAERDRYCYGVDQYLKFPIFMKSIRKFASDNKFEVADSTSNGNCMFHAIADQLIINGEFHHMAESLRRAAIRYLRLNPYHSSGSHLESFLSSETWNDYLSRMEKETEWGDHMMLKALSDSLNLPIIVFNVYEDDILQTEITPENKDTNLNRPEAYLGHIGEFHYLSLRPFNWEKQWLYKALIQRLCSFCTKYDARTLQGMIQEKIQGMGIRKYIDEARLRCPKLIVEKLQNKSTSKVTKNDNHTNDTGQSDGNEQKENGDTQKENGDKQKENGDKQPFLQTYCLQEIQLDDNEDSSKSLIEDPLHVDVLTGIPMPHLSFIIKHSMPLEMIKNFPMFFKESYFRNFMIEFVGTIVDGTEATLEDCSRDRRMFRFYVRTRKKSPSAILFELRDQGTKHHALDTTNMHPGYCRIKPYSTEGLHEDVIHKDGSNIYLKAFNMPADIAETLKITKYYAGYVCPTFPAFEWLHRRRPFDWPTPNMVREISKAGCVVIQSAHPKSESPSIEWKFKFSKAEKMLSAHWSESQRYAFYIFKIIVDYMIAHLDVKLKNKHLKSVFFYACEQIPTDSWYRCFAGCILYVLASLVECLKKKCMPHYFIPSNNIIDYYSKEEIETICVYVEAARVFPIETIHFLVERHGYAFGSRLARTVFKHCISFANDRSVCNVFKNTFIPNTIRVTGFLAKRGFYEATYALLKDAYENLLLNMEYDCGSRWQPSSFTDFIENVLDEIRDKTSRLALAKLCDKECKTSLTSRYQNLHGEQTVREVVPFETEDIIGAISVPEEYAKDLSSVASYLDKFGYQKYKQGNAYIAESAFSLAIKCIKYLLNERMMDENGVNDASLKTAILSQKERMNTALMTYYTHIYWVSALRATFTPLSTYMSEIEEHCDKVPTMSYIVSEMWYFLRESEKGQKYLKNTVF